MTTINPKIFATAEHWVSPTVQQLSTVLGVITEKYSIDVEDIWRLLKMPNDRNYRRWRAGLKSNPDKTSSIPYGYWCIFVALASDVVISGKAETTLEVDPNLITTAANYQPPPLEVSQYYFGASADTSFTGLGRNEICRMFGQNSRYLYPKLSDIPYYFWVLFLLYCGYKARDILFEEQPADKIPYDVKWAMLLNALGVPADSLYSEESVFNLDSLKHNPYELEDTDVKYRDNEIK